MIADPHPEPRVRAIAAGLAALALLASPAASSQSPSVLPEDVVRTLRLLHETDAPAVEDLGSLVGKTTPVEVLDQLIGVLADRRVPALEEGEEQILNRFQEQLILQSFEFAGRADVVLAVERVSGESEEPNVVAAALLAIGAVGESADLRRILAVAIEHDSEEVDAGVEAALERSVTAILVRDPRGFGHLSAFWPQVRLELMPALIRAVGATSDGRGVEVLGQTIVWEPELASLAVAQLRRLGPSPDPEVNARVAKNVRPQLDSKDEDYCRAVILVLGELQDYHAVPRLIELLDESPGLSGNALWSLRKLSGEDWTPSSSWWTRWYEREMEWRTSSHRQMHHQLEVGSRQAAIEALREYAEQRMFRHELAAEVADALYRPERVVRIVACETLALFSSPRAIPALVETLQDEDTQVRAAALLALHAITGEEYAEDSARWDELVLASN